MFKFITRRHFFINLLVAIALLIGILFLFLHMLGFITKHGEYEKVPEIVGKSLAEATKTLQEKGFRVSVQDSVWKNDEPPLAVMRQSPEGDQMVKAGRQIFLTINRVQPPLIDVPNLVGLSFRNAEMYLKQLGFLLGDTTRRHDIAKDAILEQLYNGRPISPGTRIFQGSSLSFVLGSGVGEDEIDVPNLIGMTFSEAKIYMTGLGLNLAAILPDANVKDSANAFVYKQNPEQITRQPDGFKQRNKIRAGQSMDLWLSNNKPEIKADPKEEEEEKVKGKENDY